MTEQTAERRADSTSGEPEAPASQARDPEGAEPSGTTLVEADLLVEDVSIDGMCGVY